MNDPSVSAARTIGRTLAALVLLTGCGRSPAQRVIYLLDQEPRPSWQRVAMGEDDRPAFALGARIDSSRPMAIASGRGTVPASREVAVAVDRGVEGGSGTLDDAEAVVVVGDAMRTDRPAVAPDGAGLLLRFAREDVGRPFQYVITAPRALRAAPRRRDFPPVAVPEDATLAVAFGVPEARCGGLPVMEVSVAAVAGADETAVLSAAIDPRRSCGEWVEMRASLGRLAGERVRLRFAVDAAGGEGGDALQVLVADPMIVPPPGAGQRPPNLVLISLDTLAASHLGAYGHAAPTSPTLDRLAREGTLFERTIAHYPSTTASHMTMLTGLLPRTHAVRGVLDRLADGVPLLAERLRDERFLTAAVTEDGALLGSMGFARGFHSYREQHGRREGRSSRRTFALASDWLRRSPAEPFFLLLHTYETHAPYDPPDAYLRAVRPDADAATAGAAWRYDAEIRLVDEALGRLLAVLTERGVLDRTILVVTSDHGEAFGEHGEWGHGGTLYGEVMRVPLIVRGPGVARGVRITARAGLVDLVPTLLNLLGLAVPDGLHGRPLPLGSPTTGGGSGPLVAELHGGIGPRGEARTRDLRAVWLGRHKAILDARRQRWQVFDLEADPGEAQDLASREPGVVGAAARAVAAYDALPIASDDVGATGVPDAAAIERLRALGYVE